MTLYMGGSRVASRTSAALFNMGLSLVWLVVAGLPAGAAVFELPGAVGWSVWEAEEAQQEG
ncbi:MAG: hypothetical protein JSV79_00265, partial [Armatimonadota bacterium]